MAVRRFLHAGICCNSLQTPSTDYCLRRHCCCRFLPLVASKGPQVLLDPAWRLPAAFPISCNAKQINGMKKNRRRNLCKNIFLSSGTTMNSNSSELLFIGKSSEVVADFCWSRQLRCRLHRCRTRQLVCRVHKKNWFFQKSAVLVNFSSYELGKWFAEFTLNSVL